jgi:hypothetical protein
MESAPPLPEPMRVAAGLAWDEPKRSPAEPFVFERAPAVLLRGGSASTARRYKR